MSIVRDELEPAVDAPRAAGAAARWHALLHGYRATCALVAAVELGVVDRLGSGAERFAELAPALGADGAALARLLRVLAALGVVSFDGDRVELTADGRELARDATPLRAQARLIAAEYLPVWSALAAGVRSGAPVAPAVLGAPVWEHRARDATLAASFDAVTSANQDALAAALCAAVDFTNARALVDVGGGSGALLVELLRRLPGASGIVLDLAHTTAAAERRIADANLGARCRVAAGSYFDAWPAPADVYLLQHVLHDVDDVRAQALLARAAEATVPGARLIVIEHLVPDGPPPLDLALLDLHMLLLHGGRERMRAEYAELLRRAGFAVDACHALRGTVHALVATRAP